jgi:hypothetical protein
MEQRIEQIWESLGKPVQDTIKEGQWEEKERYQEVV